MLKDSYNKLYNAKIKKFMRGELHGEESSFDGEIAGKSATLKHNMRLPRRGVDFGLLKSKTLNTDINSDSEYSDAGELQYGGNLNLPPMGLGLNGTSVMGAQAPRLKVDADGPQLTTPDFHLSGTLPDGPSVNTTDFKYSKKLKNPALNVDDPSNYTASPNLRLSGKSPD